MHPRDILMYGHRFFTRTLDEFPREEVYQSGACGFWSVKDLVAHLASFEVILVEILENLQNPGSPTPVLKRYKTNPMRFNDLEVDARRTHSYEEVLAEYEQVHQSVREMSGRLPVELWRTDGLLDWYGAEYDLEDYIVYSFYGHKREHAGQIQTFSDQFK
jgi:hypothetical protein